jgi:muramoyltetrapeptide carboxypeptidase LdcA involved in peptidoglycan recycling
MIIPNKLHEGNEIRVIATSRSLSLFSHEIIALAKENLENHGFTVTFSKNCRERDINNSSSIESRIDDIHDAFRDQNVKAILTATGGLSSNQLLSYLDYELIRNNPKILCGYSDITALLNAIMAKTGIVTYSGPHFSNWAMKKEFNYTLEYFKRCLMDKGEYIVEASNKWTDDSWYKDQENRIIEKNDGFWILSEGEAEGRIVGGNLSTINLLQGTEFMPDFTDSILLIEDDDLAGNYTGVMFDRYLQSLLHQPDSQNLKGIVIGRFQKESEMTIEKLKFIVQTKDLKNIPIVANADFGHTKPMITFPIGGTSRLLVRNKEVNLEIISH